MNKRNFKGFTIIELLVVVAIIAILSVIVINQINDSKNRANFAAVKQEINTIKNKAQIYITEKRGTGVVIDGLCSVAIDDTASMFSEEKIKGSINRIAKDTKISTSQMKCVAKRNYWAIAIDVNSLKQKKNGTKILSYCFDNTKGEVDETDLNFNDAIDCPTGDNKCFCLQPTP